MTPQELTTLTEHALAVAQLTSEFFGVKTPEVRVKDIRTGWARGGVLIVIPTWPWAQGEDYFTAYVVHEVAHVYRKWVSTSWWTEKTHGKEFHEAETRALAQWGLVPVYARANVHQLKKLNGDVVFTRTWRKGRVRREQKLVSGQG
jgi:hypothetical protein